jgi:hypothetical protein
MPAVFLTHASPSSHIAADSELISAALFWSRRNRRMREGERFNRRVSISVLTLNVSDLTPLAAPKLAACAVGIESVRYDFDKISLVTFFLGKKVTASLRLRQGNQRDSLCPKHSKTLPGSFATTPALRAFPSSMRRGLSGGA